jgi:acarbose 7IV-phosphotransferase
VDELVSRPAGGQPATRISAMPILVSGVVNIATNVSVSGFPLEYSVNHYPFFGINSEVSGVGFNVARVLARLGSQVHFLGFTANDLWGQAVNAALQATQVQNYSLAELAQTPQSVVLYDATGRRQVHSDLKDLPERQIEPAHFAAALAGCAVAVLGNINFNRPLLALARSAGVMVATDVHALAGLDDDYNRDFIMAADILFFSHERIEGDVSAFITALRARYATADNLRVIVVGMGAAGALLSLPNADLIHFPAIAPRGVRNSVGAGDTLFAGFLHFYAAGMAAQQALQNAVWLAGYKIGANQASEGLLSTQALHALMQAE